MDKAIRRQIKKFEKGAAKAVQLNEAAARLLKRASDIEATQKTAFDEIIVNSARAFGLDQLQLSAVISAFAALQSASIREFNPDASVANPVSAAETVESEGNAIVQMSDSNIDLIVKISRNTSPMRFALLDEHLVWNGKEGRWTGKVTLAVLKQFEELFETHRLIYSVVALGSGENGDPNATVPATELFANDPEGVAELPITDKKQVDEGGDVFSSDGIPSVKVASVDPSATIHPADNDDGHPDPAPGARELARASDAPAATIVPRNPFAGLSRRATAAG
jgi:hypothetical protein